MSMVDRLGRAYLSRHLRAIDEERERPPPPPTGETFPVRVGGSTRRMDRADVEEMLRVAGPHGASHLYHHVRGCAIDVRDFEAACAHFGLRGALEEITHDQIQEEIRARRERGEAPSTGMLPMFLNEIMPRDYADACVAIVEGRIAEARRGAGLPPAPARPAPRAAHGRRPAAPPTDASFPVRVDGDAWGMGRADIEEILREARPHSRGFLRQYIAVNMIDEGDFGAACAHFGLRGALEEITHDQIQEEIRARRERGEAPDGGLPAVLEASMPREVAHARLAIVERRIAEARPGPVRQHS